MVDENKAAAPRRSFNEQLTALREQYTAARQARDEIDAYMPLDEIERRLARFGALAFLLDEGGQADRALMRVEAQKTKRGYEAQQVEEIATTQTYRLRQELAAKRAQLEREIAALEEQLAKLERSGADGAR
jgi:hypothetical protein